VEDRAARGRKRSVPSVRPARQGSLYGADEAFLRQVLSCGYLQEEHMTDGCLCCRQMMAVIV